MKYTKIAILLSSVFVLLSCAPNNNPENKEDLTSIEKEAFYSGVSGNEIESASYGVGRGINVLEAEYIDITQTIGRRDVFDKSKILGKPWTKLNKFRSTFDEVQETSIESYYTAVNTQYSTKFGVSGYFPGELVGVPGTFNASIETGLSSSNELYDSSTDKEVITKRSVNVNGYTIAIEGYSKPQAFIDCLSDELLGDLDLFYANKLSAEDLFRYYGTHVIMGGIYGGRYELIHNFAYNSETSGFKNETEIKTKVSLGLDAIVAGIKMEEENSFSFSNEFNLNKENTVSKFTYSLTGGKTFDTLNEASFNENFAEWHDSLDGIKGEYSVLIDLPDDSLIPLWAFIPSEHSQKAIELGEKFYELGGTKESEFTSKFARYFHDVVKPDEIRYSINNLLGCYKDKTGYHLDKPETNQLNIEETKQAKDIVDLEIEGCKKVYNSDGTLKGYEVVDKMSFDFHFVAKQDYGRLKLTEPKPSGSTVHHVLVGADTDSYIDSYGNLQNPVGRGAVIYYYEYTDGTSTKDERTNRVNIFEGSSVNSIVPIRRYDDNLDLNKTIKSVNIIYVFELEAWHPGGGGFMGWGDSCTYTNWRADITIPFVG